MLWLLIRWTCRVVGVTLAAPNLSWTTVTNSIQVLFGNKKYTGLWGAVFYGLPVSLAIVAFIVVRRNYLKIDNWAFMLITIAVLWAWIGPVLIWKYETEWLNRFLLQAREVLRDTADAAILAKTASKPIFANKLGPIAIACWAVLLAVCFWLSIGFFYVDPFTGAPVYDLWWLGMLLGILIYSYYTGLGFLLSARTVLLTYRLSQRRIEIDPYDSDERGALGFVGRYATRASWSFASGLLFVPLLLYVNINFVRQYGYFIYTYVTVYSLSIFLVFLIPVITLHRAIVREKRDQIAQLRVKIWNLFREIIKTGRIEAYTQYTIQHNLVIDIRNIGEWPFKPRNIAGPVILAIAGILAAVLREWRFLLGIWLGI
jgi:hypothetical protein